MTSFCHFSYLCISVWPLNQISSQGFHSYYSQRPSCNSWSTLDLGFITATALVPHVRQPGHVFQYSLSSQGGWKRLCAKPISSSYHRMPQPGPSGSQFHVASGYLSLHGCSWCQPLRLLPRYQSRGYPRKPSGSVTRLQLLKLKLVFDDFQPG